MLARPHAQQPGSRRPGWDALLLAVLVFAQLRIGSLAEPLAIPLARQDAMRHPLLGRLLSAEGWAEMGERGPWPAEPLALLLIALTLACTLAYLLVDLARPGRLRTAAKWTFLVAILSTTIVLPTARLILLRAQSGPASYTHDGGVIQTEATIDFFLSGRNPYVEDYTETPMAEWGFDEYRTALYHYPYLPWTFVFSAPFALVGQALGGYDQRIVYLLLWAIMLILAARLARDQRTQLGLVMLLGLNPIMGLDVIFGQNDSFVLAWIVFSLLAWQRWRKAGPSPADGQSWLWASTICYGLACASKPTAWFLAPFYALLLLAKDDSFAAAGWLGILRGVPVVLRRVWPALAVFGLLVGPYLVWDAAALYDDVWRWSSGQGETGYQIWGWGASNFILALGLVTDRFGQWPFWIVQVTLTLPVLLWFLHRQQKDNTLSAAAWHYAILLAIFFYGSRFLNENYLGYILAFMAIGFATDSEDAPAA
ncbi:MAG: hypothetical protein R2873_30865 [Caldilineaceae bacterium]